MRHLGDRSLARALGQRARALRSELADGAWSDDEIQLVVAGLYGARLLAMSDAAATFDRACIAQLFAQGDHLLERTMRRALSTHEPRTIREAVDEIIAMLAPASVTHEQPAVSGLLLAFYEPFLQAYDTQLRRSRGVYFTPPQLAAHVVARVDDILEHELKIRDGVADVSMIDGEPAVCALDPAAGVGAFLSAWIERVYAHVSHACSAHGSSQEACRSAWRAYVPKSLLPRTIGFEVMPVAHALSRLQLRLVLAATGYELQASDILELHCTDALALLQGLGSHDASEPPSDPAYRALARASVIIGNPPYARGGATRDAFWRELLEVYKKPVRAEKNLQPLADDYLRFLRFTEHLLLRKDLGIAGLITNSTFLSGHLHRGVRESLLQTFARIDVLDLGGSTKRSSRDAERERDENVFGVAQGIAFTLFSRAPRSSSASQVRYAKLAGRSVDKLASLEHLDSQAQVDVSPAQPSFAFVPIRRVPPEYERFIPLDQLFDWSSIAAKPGDDGLLVSFERDDLVARVQAFRTAATLDRSLARTEAARRIRDFEGAIDTSHVVPYAYRPFDTRFVYDDANIWTRPVRRLRARIDGEPMLLTTRIAQDGKFAHVFATRLVPDVIFLSNKSSVNCFAFHRSALRANVVSEARGVTTDPSVAFAYVYALLHASAYRERYASALAQDFARVPVTRDSSLFDDLARSGAALLALHLGESKLDGVVQPHLVPGTKLDLDARSLSWRRESEDGSGALRIAVNADTAFEGVPRDAWQLRVGGYQVCHKWLLDRARAGRVVDTALAAQFAVVVGLAAQTVRLVSEIDRCVADAGGFPAAFVG